jgi:capsid protein
VTFGNPPPAEQYDAYTTKILQGIAASYGITYEMLTMDYSKVNFSSGKMAQINVTANFREWQYNMMVPQICVPVWNWFMEGVLVAGLMTTRLSCSCTDWTAPRVAQLDPMKETSARILAIQGGLTTVSECLREDGRDPDEFFDEYKRDKDRLEKLGITLSSIMLPQIIEQVQNKDEMKP